MKARTRDTERTGFQEGSPYNEKIDLQTDFVMVYGIDSSMPARIRSWKERGYVVHLMTGVSWGAYQDYLNGKADGRPHWDEAQKDRNYENIIHGTSKDIPYMVPTIAYTDFLTGRIRLAVDSGVEAIHLEEPEFWVEGGYSDAFKREWELYYKEAWKAPHETEDAQYRASKLKAYLYTRCLDRLCNTLKEYAKVRYNRNLRFYVPTHSLINYTQWRIISPESKLLELPGVDGYIAQIWTGTSRTPNVYEGVRRERTFETAFLEYGVMQELIRGTNRRMWFLHDPIEDDPAHSWKDYRRNYIKTVIASLFHPVVSRYEICPWPNRIFNGKYATEDGLGKETIPSSYGTTLLTIMNTLGDMEQSEVAWLNGNTEVGLLLADSAMFQRNGPQWSEEATAFKYDGTDVKSAEGEEFKELLDWSPFYGLALPLLKHGLPVRPVQLDNIRRFTGYLDDYHVLVLSYEYMKPEYPDLHNALAQWVREGGALIYVGDGSDSFHQVREWWNQGKRIYANPAEHLFESLGLEKNLQSGIHAAGEGSLTLLPFHPALCAQDKGYASQLRDAVRSAITSFKEPGISWNPTNGLVLQRGPYTIVSVMDESVNDDPVGLVGSYIDLLDPELPLVINPHVRCGGQGLLYDMSRVDPGIQLIAAASRIERIQELANGFSFTAKGPEGIKAIACFQCKVEPKIVLAQHAGYEAADVTFDWDEAASIVRLYYNNHPDGVDFKLTS
jgi:hypothetical protein